MKYFHAHCTNFPLPVLAGYSVASVWQWHSPAVLLLCTLLSSASIYSHFTLLIRDAGNEGWTLEARFSQSI